MTYPTLPLHPFPQKPSKINFDENKLGLEWNYIQYPNTKNFSLEERPGYLRLHGSPETISTNKTSTFVGRRLEDFYFTATMLLDFEPENKNEEAGMILLNNGSHFDILIKNENDKRVLFVKLQFGRTNYTSKEYILEPGPVKLKIQGEKTTFTFSFAQGAGKFINVETADAKFLATETVGFFTGIYVGLYATGNGKSSEANADFDWFEYKKESPPDATKRQF